MATPNDLTGDFAFDDGVDQAIILFFGQAGQLPAGTWMVETWIWDSTIASLGNMFVGYRDDGMEFEQTDAAVPDATDPASTFTFVSDGTSRYDLYVRENNAGNRARLNAVRLTLIPEPSSSLLALLSGLFFLGQRRRL